MKLIVKALCRIFPSALAAILCITASIPPATARVTTHPPEPGIVASFDELLDFIGAIPADQLNKGVKNAFLSRVRNALDAYERGQVCTAANVLQASMNQAQALRRARSIAVAEELYNRGRQLRDEIVRSEVPPSPCADSSLDRSPELQVLESDNHHFSARVAFGAPRFWTVQEGGETWTQMSLPGVDNLVGAPGFPAVPSWQAIIGVPRGAAVSLPAVQKSTSEQLMLNLYPYQNQPVDQTDPRFENEPLPPPSTFMNPPFVKSEEVYSTPGFYPPSPCAVKLLGEIRDLDIAQIECEAGQYDPVSDQMILFDSIQFDVQFDGGDGTFVTNQTLSPFEPASSSSIQEVVNAPAVGSYVKVIDFHLLPCFGEELLILTHPDFRDAADDLAEWKRDKGIMTSVYEVGSGTPRATAAEIDDFIENRYQNCIVRPSYVLIVGDSEFVPPAKLDYSTSGDSTNGSDWGYSTYSRTFFNNLPWFAVGRIPVDTASEAQTVVDKTIQYESHPPFLGFGGGAPFYTSTTNASYFQCCRTNVTQAGRTMRSFVITSELARDVMMARGYSVDRIYTTDTDYAAATVTDPTPRRYYDGASLPADLAPGSGFGWNGTAADVVNAINDGRFLVFHRDHGGSSGWVSPAFTTANFGSLTNGELLPFMFSVNCASGYWDRETDTGSPTESFMERLLMLPGGGIVAGLGDNRNSPSWENSALSRGFFDAVFPETVSFGGTSAKHRLGDILIHGKIYLLSQYGVAQPAGSIRLDELLGEWVMWHAFGDPTAEIWTGNPYHFVLPLSYQLLLGDSGLDLQYAAPGATLTAWQMGKDALVPVGRGLVMGDGSVHVPFFVPPDPDLPILLSASKENAVSVFLTGGGAPDLVVRAIELTGTTVMPGQDLSGMMKVVVSNIGSAGAPGTIMNDGTPRPAGEGYMIDLVLSSDASMPTGFATLPLPEGVAYGEDGLLQGGRISRTPDVGAGASVDLPAPAPISSDVGGIIPLQAPIGPQYLCARIDPGEAVAESDESNNVTCIPVTVASV
ncbi:MAG: C25 family cysteine peptidase, partial [Thermoanaerobaculia bacterium]